MKRALVIFIGLLLVVSLAVVNGCKQKQEEETMVPQVTEQAPTMAEEGAPAPSQQELPQEEQQAAPEQKQE